ncbi:MAG: hypothetical protein Q7N50_16085 [Armatimonadota bacterium]|nr:hypothetical protein [Armatimonadota bacterium]
MAIECVGDEENHLYNLLGIVLLSDYIKSYLTALDCYTRNKTGVGKRPLSELNDLRKVLSLRKSIANKRDTILNLVFGLRMTDIEHIYKRLNLKNLDDVYLASGVLSVHLRTGIRAAEKSDTDRLASFLADSPHYLIMDLNQHGLLRPEAYDWCTNITCWTREKMTTESGRTEIVREAKVFMEIQAYAQEQFKPTSWEASASGK